MVAFIPIERRMLIRWCWNAEAEEFATEKHGKTRKEDTHTAFRAGCVSDGIKNEHSHGITRKEAEATEGKYIF